MNHWSGNHFDTTLSVSMSGPVRIYDLAVGHDIPMGRHAAKSKAK